MNPSFAGGARRLASLSAQALGWRPHEFWTATPAELELSLGPCDQQATPPDRSLIDALMERDRYG